MLWGWEDGFLFKGSLWRNPYGKLDFFFFFIKSNFIENQLSAKGGHFECIAWCISSNVCTNPVITTLKMEKMSIFPKTLLRLLTVIGHLCLQDVVTFVVLVTVS